MSRPPQRILGAVVIAAAVAVIVLLLRPADGDVPISQRSHRDAGAAARSLTASTDTGAPHRQELAPASPPEERADIDPVPWRVIATVVDHDGRAIPNAAVAVTAHSSRSRADDNRLGSDDRGTTDANGRCTVPLADFAALSPLLRDTADIHCAVNADGYMEQSTDVSFLALDAAGQVELTFELDAGRLVKGRVVTNEGEPVREARVAYLPEPFEDARATVAETGLDGRFELERHDDDHAGALLVASHPRFGLGYPFRPALRAPGDTVVGDIVLERTTGVLEGRVTLRDGSPAPGVDVEVWRDDDPEGEAPPDPATNLLLAAVARGPDFDAPDGWLVEAAPSVSTDAEGRFRYALLRPGRYTVEVEVGEAAARTEVEVGDAPVRVALTIDACRVHVDVRDAAGVPLDAAHYVVALWEGASAAAARQRYAQSGPSEEMLASADRTVGLLEAGSDRWVACTSPAFAVVGVACADAGPEYGTCYLPAGKHRGDVSFRLRRRRPASALKLDLRTPDGTPIAAGMVRLRVGALGRFVFWRLPGLPLHRRPSIGYGYPFYEVPADGVLRDLPAGTLSVEVLPGATAGGEHPSCPFPLLQTDVTLAANSTADLRATCQPGAPLALELRGIGLRADERLQLQCSVSLAGGSTGRGGTDLDLRAPRGHKFTVGHAPVIATAIRSFAAGSYDLSVSFFARIERRDTAVYPPRWRHVDGVELAPIERAIQLAPDSPPVPIALEVR